MSRTPNQAAGDTLTRTRTEAKTASPPQYRVLLLNDDYTTWDFVLYVLMRYFRKDLAEAQRITRDVHQQGVGLAGIYPFEVAETKAEQVNRAARQEGHPFRATLEPD